MNPITLSKSSWHYRLATYYGSLKVSYWDYAVDSFDEIEVPHNIDSCTYIQHVMKGLLIIVVLTAMFVGLVGVPFSDFLMWGMVAAQYSFVQMHGAAVWFALLATAALGTTVLVGIWIGIDKALKSYRRRSFRLTKPALQKKTSFLRVLYTKLHDKTCVMVEFK